MQMTEFLRKATVIPGVTGNERRIAEYVRDCFAPLCDEVSIDCMNNVIAHKKGSGPRVAVFAHIDEIGMMVSAIEEDGCLRMAPVGGVDPRILPGMRVRVYGTQPLMGVVGAKAPHLMDAKEREVNYTFDNLYIDLGMDAEKVRTLVQVGDTVCLEHHYTELLNHRISVKTCDDRACVAMMLKACEALGEMRHEADLWFVASTQEEIGSHGASAACFGIDPDLCVAFDVCHAVTPGAPEKMTFDLSALVATMGPFINPFMRAKLTEVAKQQNIRLQPSVRARQTFTDADFVSIVRGGIPTVLFELPLRYMHTHVEVADTRVLEDGARLLTHYLRAIDSTWEESLWI